MVSHIYSWEVALLSLTELVIAMQQQARRLMVEEGKLLNEIAAIA